MFERQGTNMTAREASPQLEALLNEFASRGIPGITAAVGTRRGLLWTGASGFANLETREPMHSEMLLGIGSITKTFVATVILQLVEEDRVRIDQTAADILGPSVSAIANAGRANIGQLLNHTSGIPSWEDDPQWIRAGRGDQLDASRVWGKRETLDYITHQPPLFPPGQKYSYSNTNYTLLGMIIEAITGVEAVCAIRARILEPLALKDIHFEGFESVSLNKLPRRYHWATSDFRRDAGVNVAFHEVLPQLIDASSSNLSTEWMAGGMVATARELVLYGAALRDGQLLNAQSMEFMTRWMPVQTDAQVGHNLFRKEYPGRPAAIGHNGAVLGFSATWYWLEGLDAVIAMIWNVGTVHSGQVPATILAADKILFTDGALQVARDASP